MGFRGPYRLDEYGDTLIRDSVTRLVSLLASSFPRILLQKLQHRHLVAPQRG